MQAGGREFDSPWLHQMVLCSGQHKRYLTIWRIEKAIRRYRVDMFITCSLRLFEVIESSEQVHTVDAWAVEGDEGRGSLR